MDKQDLILEKYNKTVFKKQQTKDVSSVKIVLMDIINRMANNSQ